MTEPLPGMSIVCVYNDPSVRTECLDRSIAAYQGDLQIEYIPVDNTAHAFPTAGAALNYGARQASHDLVVFVHQDVYLHSLDRLADAAKAFEEGSWGVLGANGITSDNVSVGRLRDRTDLLGLSAHRPIEVDTLDEVLFMVPRQRVLDHPLTEAADLAWHAYAVEYCLRLRSMGLRAGAVNVAITHNSLTVNLARLDVAHRSVGRDYPQLAPIHTTCGTLGGRVSWIRSNPVSSRHGWRLRWLSRSVLAARARNRTDVPTVFSDIRVDVDLLTAGVSRTIQLINLDPTGGFVEYAREAVEFTRHQRPIVMRTVASVAELNELMLALPPEEVILIVGIGLDELNDVLRPDCTTRPWVIGIQPGGMWLLGRYPYDHLPEEWSRPAAVPLGTRSIAASTVGSAGSGRLARPTRTEVSS